MEKKRLLELMAYAKVCFDKCTTPFETTHLRKKNVKASECVELGREIAGAIEDELSWAYDFKELEDAIAKAEKEFAETQI